MECAHLFPFQRRLVLLLPYFQRALRRLGSSLGFSPAPLSRRLHMKQCCFHEIDGMNSVTPWILRFDGCALRRLSSGLGVGSAPLSRRLHVEAHDLRLMTTSYMSRLMTTWKKQPPPRKLQ